MTRKEKALTLTVLQSSQALITLFVKQKEPNMYVRTTLLM